MTTFCHNDYVIVCNLSIPNDYISFQIKLNLVIPALEMFCVCLKTITLHDFLFLLPLLHTNFSKILGSPEQKIYFHEIQLFVAIKGNFSCLFLFSTSRSKGKLPRDYLKNVATCLFAYH